MNDLQQNKIDFRLVVDLSAKFIADESHSDRPGKHRKQEGKLVKHGARR